MSDPKTDDIIKEKLIPASPTEESYRVDEDQGNVFTETDPFELFATWLAEARNKEMNDPNAMALATIDAQGRPDVRIVLLKDITRHGLSFFTNIKSAKGQGIAANPIGALCFHWKSIRRQVRLRGTIEAVSDQEADAYFATRARGAQIGAWASLQSQSLGAQQTLIDRCAQLEQDYAGKEIPRPRHWSGYRLLPLEIEFWVNRPYRLHERLQFSRKTLNDEWVTCRLYP